MWMGMNSLWALYAFGSGVSLLFLLLSWMEFSPWRRSKQGLLFLGLCLIASIVWPLLLLFSVWFWFAEMVVLASGSRREKRGKTK